jgi:large subunit ribosomal protein L4
MAVLDIVDKNNVKLRETGIDDSLLTSDPNADVVHQVVVAHQAAQRQGTHQAKNRRVVHYSNQKPWKQKGTGRARAGMRSSPLWGNSVIFPPVPRSYRQRVPKKMRWLAFRSVLGSKISAGEVKVLSDYDLTTPKTKEAVALLNRLGLHGKVLAVISGDERNFQLASRNLPNVRTARPSGVDLISLMDCDALLFSEASLKQFEECHRHG